MSLLVAVLSMRIQWTGTVLTSSPGCNTLSPFLDCNRKQEHTCRITTMYNLSLYAALVEKHCKFERVKRMFHVHVHVQVHHQRLMQSRISMCK